MNHLIDPMLLDIAEWRLADRITKQAFTPPEAMVPPGDPSAAGGAPPAGMGAMGGGMPPMDPAMMASMGGGMGGGMEGGMPPVDPSMAAAGGMGGIPPELQAMITQAVQQAMSQQTGSPAAPGSGAAGPGKGAKIDPGMIYLELGRVRKMLTTMFQNMGWNLPPDILDDQMVAQAVAGQSPTSAPISADAAATDPSVGVSLPAIGTSPAISPMAAPDMGKQASIKDMLLRRKGPEGLQQNLDVAVQMLLARNRR
jgi:hypothetical protein